MSLAKRLYEKRKNPTDSSHLVTEGELVRFFESGDLLAEVGDHHGHYELDEVESMPDEDYLDGGGDA
jgi:hypothetical protein